VAKPSSSEADGSPPLAPAVHRPSLQASLVLAYLQRFDYFRIPRYFSASIGVDVTQAPSKEMENSDICRSQRGKSCYIDDLIQTALLSASSHVLCREKSENEGRPRAPMSFGRDFPTLSFCFRKAFSASFNFLGLPTAKPIAANRRFASKQPTLRRPVHGRGQPPS
jgi:hypothetical protein